MLLGAARLLKEYEDEIPGTVKLMFQPAEEIFEGAHDMIEAGVLENPKVDAALMIHVMANAPLPDGTVLVSAPGVSAPAADTFTIRIQGKGCHGSMPNTGVDPLIPAAQILLALQELQTRELSVSDRSVLTIGVVQAGTAPNIIPDSVTMSGTIRTYDEAVRSLLKKRMKELSAGIAAAFRASVEVTFGSGCPPLRNDPALSEAATRYAKELLGEQKAMSVVQLTAMSAGSSSGSKSAGSEDFAYVSQAVPSIMLALMAGQAADGCGFPQHHPQVRFSEEVLAAGAAVYAYLAMRWLEEQAEQQGIL
jgi:hippurate hydrolase